jgi:hypothetical protein
MEDFMLTVEKIDTRNKTQARRFVNISYRLYAKCKQWVPPLLMDVNTQLNRDKHPFYEHSQADFFIVSRDGRDVGRIAALENKPFNKYHGTHKANIYLFECEDDQEAANALFERVFDWAKARGLDTIVGPKGFGPIDGYGMQIEGFEHRQMMMMMNYNYPYYNTLVQNLGFEKEVDFISCYINRKIFKMPERVHSIARRVEERGILKVQQFKSKRELIKKWAHKIGQTYNESFINNWEYYPLTEREVQFTVDNLLIVADHRLIKIITHNEDVVGFVFAFPDISAALQRARGHLLPFGLPDFLLEMKRTKWLSLNGAGILPEFQGRGGNALLYTEMEKTLTDYHFTEAELTQVAETAVQMRRDLVNLGGKPYKNHRVYIKHL